MVLFFAGLFAKLNCVMRTQKMVGLLSCFIEECNIRSRIMFLIKVI